MYTYHDHTNNILHNTHEIHDYHLHDRWSSFLMPQLRLRFQSKPKQPSYVVMNAKQLTQLINWQYYAILMSEWLQEAIFWHWQNILALRWLDGCGYFETLLIYLRKRALYKKKIRKIPKFKSNICGVFLY